MTRAQVAVDGVHLRRLRQVEQLRGYTGKIGCGIRAQDANTSSDCSEEPLACPVEHTVDGARDEDSQDALDGDETEDEIDEDERISAMVTVLQVACE